jgi:hypothetical protein
MAVRGDQEMAGIVGKGVEHPKSVVASREDVTAAVVAFFGFAAENAVLLTSLLDEF